MTGVYYRFGLGLGFWLYVAVRVAGVRLGIWL